MRSRRREKKRRITNLLTFESLEDRKLLAADLFSSGAAPIQNDTAPDVAIMSTQDNQDQDSSVQRIVNGTETSGYESVGIVNRGCTGTLISPTHVLTAAHCVQGIGATSGTFEVNGQLYRTSSITVHENYDPNAFYLSFDIAIMELDRPVTGITPSDIMRTAPDIGAMMTLVGFGQGGTSNDPVFDFGTKRVGQTAIETLTQNHINWTLDSISEANTAPGDSGGPAFVEVNGELVLAGITSGGGGNAHAIGSGSFDTRVDTLAGWIDAIVGNTDPDPDPGQDDHVNQPGDNATVINLDANGNGANSGDLEVAGDVDVFKIVVAESGSATITSTASNGSRLDTVLKVTNENGDVVAENDDFGGTRNSQVAMNLEAGTYFVSVGSYNNAGSGTYDVAVAIESDPGDPDPGEDDHVNDVGADATVIQLDADGNGSGFGNMEVSNDADVFQFTVDEAGHASISVNAVFSGFDPVVQILNSNGEVIADDDDSGEGLNSFAELNLEAGTYFVKVTSYAETEGRQYGLVIDLNVDRSDSDRSANRLTNLDQVFVDLQLA